MLRLAATLALMAAPAAAQAVLPVKIYPDIQAFRGGPNVVITEDGAARYSLFSGHKEARRPWADVIVRKDSADGVSYLSRAFDCRAGTVRRLGEGKTIRDIPLSISSPAAVRDQPVIPGTLDYAIGRFACGL